MADYDYLFVRPDAKLDGSKPISGGLPHCFPQFGPGVIQQHGFARNLEWDVVETTPSSISLKLSDNEQTMAMWPHPFECNYKVCCSREVFCVSHIHPSCTRAELMRDVS